jgi:hypothetical protein
MPSSILRAQVPTASGLTALAHCSRYASFVGLGLAGEPVAISEIRIVRCGSESAQGNYSGVSWNCAMEAKRWQGKELSKIGLKKIALLDNRSRLE